MSDEPEEGVVGGINLHRFLSDNKKEREAYWVVLVIRWALYFIAAVRRASSSPRSNMSAERSARELKRATELNLHRLRWAILAAVPLPSPRNTATMESAPLPTRRGYAKRRTAKGVRNWRRQ